MSVALEANYEAIGGDWQICLGRWINLLLSVLASLSCADSPGTIPPFTATFTRWVNAESESSKDQTNVWVPAIQQAHSECTWELFNCDESIDYTLA